MKTVTKQYSDLCRSCSGTGQLADVPDTTNPFRTCPACGGTGVVTVTETITEDDWLEQIGELIPNHLKRHKL